jgi:hypothetical protein
MPNTWSIMINQNPDGTVSFKPDVAGAQAGQPLGVQPNDLVTWNNRTNQALTLQSIPPGTYLTDPVPAGQVSSPAYAVGATAGTVTYSCVQPLQQQHSIVVITNPPSTPTS